MNSLVPRPVAGLLASDHTQPLPPEPKVPELLEQLVGAYLGAETPWTFQTQLKALPKSPRSVPAVQALIEAYDAHLSVPVDKEALEEWLLPLRDAVTFPPDQAGFDGRIDAVLKRDPALPLLPLACLSARSYAAAVRAFPKWPSASELIELLEAQTRILTLRRSALQAIYDGIQKLEEPPAPRRPPTEKEKAHVSGAVASLMRDLRAASIPGPREQPKAGRAPVKRTRTDDLALIGSLRAQLAGATPERAAFLKQRLAGLEGDMPQAAE